MLNVIQAPHGKTVREADSRDSVAERGNSRQLSQEKKRQLFSQIMALLRDSQFYSNARLREGKEGDSF